MKLKDYSKFLFLVLPFLIFTIGCEDDSDDGPVVENQPPEISGLNDLTLAPGFETYEIDFANYVSDQEGEIISYEVSNSNESVITTSLDNSVLTITEVGPGTSDITVTATDGNEGHEVNHTFSVIVEAISGAPDYTGNAAVLLDFNGYGTGSIFDNPVPGLIVEGWTYDWENGDFGSFTLENNDHLMVVNNIDSTWIWVEYGLDGNQDYTGKKFRFDYSYYSAPNLTGTYWEDDPDGIDIRVWYVDESWEAGGGNVFFSDLNLEYSAEWQTVEIPLADFTSLWDLPVDPSQVANIGIEIWGGTSDDPISFRLDNFGIVD